MFNNKSYKKSLLLIGPEPPPSHGTSVKFGLFCDIARQKLGDHAVDIINTQTGDKAITSIFSLSSIAGYLRILFLAVRKVFRADVIVVFGSQRFATVFGAIAVLMSVPLRKPVYISFFGGGFDKYFESLSGSIRNLSWRILKGCKGIIVETDHQRTVLAEVWPGKIHYVPNFRKPALDSKARIHSRPDQIRFLYVGVIRREKGIGELLKAFAEVEKKTKKGALAKNIYLDLYGPIYTSSRDFVDLDLVSNSTSISVHGEVSHDAALKAYADADVFVYPSYWPTEGHSGAVIEALMQGLPVIAADWRAIRELVYENQNGLLCPPRDSAALAIAMERMILDEQLRTRCAEQSRRLSHIFDAEIACSMMLKIILNQNFV